MGNRRIAALLAGLDREYQQGFAWGMTRAAKLQDIDLCIFHCAGMADYQLEWSATGEDGIFDLPRLTDFDGVIVLPSTMPTRDAMDKLNRLLAESDGVPSITVDAKAAQGVSMMFDDTISLRALMAHLMDVHGARRFALVRGTTGNPVAQSRLDVCIDALTCRGLKVPDQRVFDGGWTRMGGRKAAEMLLGSGEALPDAIVCGNDDMALGVVETLTEAKVNVPGRVLVTGFDATREAVACGLTTIRRPVRDAGEVAVEMLAAWMAGKAPDRQTMMLPTQIVYGRSCGCHREEAQVDAMVRLQASDKRRGERTLLMVSGLTGSLAGAQNAAEAGQIMDDFAAKGNVKEMHVCIDPGLLADGQKRSRGGFPKELLLLSSVKDGKTSMQTVFPRERLLPVLDEPHEEALCLTFCPLHEQGALTGYVALPMEHASVFSIYAVMNLLSGALTSLSLQCTVRECLRSMAAMASHDPLTGLYNRRGCGDLVPELFERAKKEKRCFAVINADLDGLKRINDQYGHLAGDRAIVRAAKAFRTLEKNGMICVHVSGDEFCASGMVESEAQGAIMVQRVRDAVAQLNVQAGREGIHISVSLGLKAGVPRGSDTLKKWEDAADAAMYRCKRRNHRRNCIRNRR